MIHFPCQSGVFLPRNIEAYDRLNQDDIHFCRFEQNDVPPLVYELVSEVFRIKCILLISSEKLNPSKTVKQRNCQNSQTKCFKMKTVTRL